MTYRPLNGEEQPAGKTAENTAGGVQEAPETLAK